MFIFYCFKPRLDIYLVTNEVQQVRCLEISLHPNSAPIPGNNFFPPKTICLFPGKNYGNKYMFMKIVLFS